MNKPLCDFSFLFNGDGNALLPRVAVNVVTGPISYGGLNPSSAPTSFGNLGADGGLTIDQANCSLTGAVLTVAFNETPTADARYTVTGTLFYD